MSNFYNFNHGTTSVSESVFNLVQEVETLMLAADMSSTLLAHPLDAHQENMLSSVYNFSDDAATVPEWVLNNAQEAQNLTPIADISPNSLSNPIDVNWFEAIYACAQKKLESAGIAIVILREDLIGHAHPLTTELPFPVQHRIGKALF